jgi:hypothetical protein
MLPFLYGAESPQISDQPFVAERPGDFDNSGNAFNVKWVVHRYETLPVVVESGVLQDLDELVKSCRARFPEMRHKYPNTPPRWLSRVQQRWE